ncbi:MAG: glycerophosphodiester phosphodiesterase family protein, partial [Dokdonella sp.]
MNSIIGAAAKTLVIAHRGASALRPEHTLAAYAKAIEDGADFIEPDLVMTRDGVLVARHDVELSRSTDIAERADFALRRTTKRVDGDIVEGWFCVDFTFAELQVLRAREPMPELRSRNHDGLHGIPTFDAIVELAANESRRHNRLIGIIPEIKNSTWFHETGLDPEQTLLDALDRHAYLREAPFGIQSFEVSNLERLRERIGHQPNVLLVQLIGDSNQLPFDRFVVGDNEHTYAAMLTAPGLLAV